MIGTMIMTMTMIIMIMIMKMIMRMIMTMKMMMMMMLLLVVVVLVVVVMMTDNQLSARRSHTPALFSVRGRFFFFHWWRHHWKSSVGLSRFYATSIADRAPKCQESVRFNCICSESQRRKCTSVHPAQLPLNGWMFPQSALCHPMASLRRSSFLCTPWMTLGTTLWRTLPRKINLFSNELVHFIVLANNRCFFVVIHESE